MGKGQKLRIFCKVMVMVLISIGWGPAHSMAEQIETGDSPVLNRIVQNGVIRVGVNPLFKPFSFTNDKNERVGVDIDIANHLAKSLDVKLEIVVPPAFRDLFPMLLDGKIDIVIAAMSRIFERAKIVDFTKAYYDTGISIMLNKAKGSELGVGQTNDYRIFMKQLQRLGKENQLTIAATTGKGSIKSVPRFFPKAKVREYPTNEKSAEAVANGDTHIMVHDEIFLKTWVQDNPSKALYKVIVFPKPYKPDTYGFAIAKNNAAFLNLLNMFIDDQLKAQGYFEKFLRKYIEPPRKAPPTDVGESEL